MSTKVNLWNHNVHNDHMDWSFSTPPKKKRKRWKDWLRKHSERRKSSWVLPEGMTWMVVDNTVCVKPSLILVSASNPDQSGFDDLGGWGHLLVIWRKTWKCSLSPGVPQNPKAGWKGKERVLYLPAWKAVSSLRTWNKCSWGNGEEECVLDAEFVKSHTLGRFAIQTSPPNQLYKSEAQPKPKATHYKIQQK